MVSDEGTGGFGSASRGGRVRVFPALDGLRAVAAVLVVLCHAGAVTWLSFRSDLGNYLARMDVGVPIFFVLSGFLLYRPFVLRHLGGGGHPPLARFWVRRAARIFPAYWVALTLVPFVVGRTFVHDATDATIYYGLLQAYDANRVLGGLYQAWSLCTELAFYLFLPLYALVQGRQQRPPAQQLRRELVGLVGLYLASVAYRVLLLVMGVTGYQFTWLPAWLDVFALGMLLAVASAWMTTTAVVPRPVAFVMRRPEVALGAAVSAFVVVANLGMPTGLAPLSSWHRLAGQLLYSVVAVALVAPAVFVTTGRLPALLTSRPLAAVGLVSYSIYLWHPAMIDKAVEWTGGRTLAAEAGPVFVLALALSFGVAAVSYAVVERPGATVSELRSGPQPSPRAVPPRPAG